MSAKTIKANKKDLRDLAFAGGTLVLSEWRQREAWELSVRLCKAWDGFAHAYPQINFGTNTKATRLADHTLNDALNLYLERRISEDDLKRIWRAWCEAYIRACGAQRRAAKTVDTLKVPTL